MSPPSSTLEVPDVYHLQSDQILEHYAHQVDEKRRKTVRRDFSRRIKVRLISWFLGLVFFAIVMFATTTRTSGGFGGTLHNAGADSSGVAVKKSGTFYAHAGQILRVQYNSNASTNRTLFTVMQKKFFSKPLDLRSVASGAGNFDVLVPASGFYHLEVDDNATTDERTAQNYAWDYSVSWKLAG